jgi:hypothetical protein
MKPAETVISELFRGRSREKAAAAVGISSLPIGSWIFLLMEIKKADAGVRLG